MNKAPLTLSIQDSVATVIIDDGKANALNRSIIDPLLRSLGAAEADARAVVVAGRPGMFCAGLDTNVLRAGDHTTTDLFHRCTELILRLAEFPRPVVAACTGHALATGALMLLCCDIRVGAAGDFKIGFNEVSLGMPMPELEVALARERLSSQHVTKACNTAQIYAPSEAVHAGFLDSTSMGDVVARARETAADLAERLDPDAFAATRVTTCRGLTDTIMRTSGDLLRIKRAIEKAPRPLRSATTPSTRS